MDDPELLSPVPYSSAIGSVMYLMIYAHPGLRLAVGAAIAVLRKPDCYSLKGCETCISILEGIQTHWNSSSSPQEFEKDVEGISMRGDFWS